MILRTIILLVIAGMTLADKVSTIGELKKQLYEKETELNKAMAEYRSKGYLRFEYLADRTKGYHSYNKKLIDAMPDNTSTQNMNSKVEEIYNWIMEQLFAYSVVANAGHLSDALKVDLLSFTIKENYKDFESFFDEETNPDMKISQIHSEAVRMIMNTINLEKGVLINGRLTKPNEALENIYKNMSRQAEGSVLGYLKFNVTGPWYTLQIASESSKVLASIMHDHCTLPESRCKVGFKKTIKNFSDADQKFRSNMPIDSRKKVDNIVQIFPVYAENKWEFVSELRSYAYRANLACLHSGCRKYE